MCTYRDGEIYYRGSLFIVFFLPTSFFLHCRQRRLDCEKNLRKYCGFPFSFSPLVGCLYFLSCLHLCADVMTKWKKPLEHQEHCGGSAMKSLPLKRKLFPERCPTGGAVTALGVASRSRKRSSCPKGGTAARSCTADGLVSPQFVEQTIRFLKKCVAQ